jgi:hypothetical protein
MQDARPGAAPAAHTRTVSFRLLREEPDASPWRVEPFADVLARLLAAAGDADGRPRLIAVDGRSGGGKTTFAERIAGGVTRGAMVHTDDVAWWQSRFDWALLLADGVLDPLRCGRAVAFRPPAWETRGRDGAIEVPAGCEVVVVEGVGASRKSLAPLLDATVWVQSDIVDARERCIARDGGTEEARAFFDDWASEEEPFLAADRPWERANEIVAGMAAVPYDARSEVLVGGLRDVGA